MLLLAYIGLTLGVIHRSPLLTLDTDVLRLDLHQRYPEWFRWINAYVVLGQRGPSTLVALPWLLWRAWRTRSARSLIALGTALLVLNVSVGIVKIYIGRLGPLRTHDAFKPFAGGNIFPSGHTANAVVLYGVLAMVAVNYRKIAAWTAVFISVTVGLCTLYLDTHWLTDVLGGWMAGALVMIVLPKLTPISERIVYGSARGLRDGVRALRRLRESPAPVPTPVVSPVPVRIHILGATGETAEAHREPVSVIRG